jgi:DNA-binding response OmpR family regulator
MPISSSTVPKPRAAAGLGPASPGTILLVDDDEYVHVALTATLRSLRATILRATTAAEALELARSQPPDLAIIDLGLPDADGYQLTRWLRAEPGLDELRILMITGQSPDERAARKAGADQILGKPFKLHEFMEAVTRHLGSRSPAS